MDPTLLTRRPVLLIVEDDASNRSSLQDLFARENYQVLVAADGKEAVETLRHETVDVVLTDLMMPSMSGLELLRSVKAMSPGTEVVLMTAYGTVERAVEAMKEGAYDFVTKPFKAIQILRSVRRGMEKQSLLLENRNLRERLKQMDQGRRGLIGNSQPMRRLVAMIRQVAPSSATVLIQGESGTGKELVARELHEFSPRAGRAFIPFNCAVITSSLAEAELFGHEKGAYTGAHKSRPGVFKEADGGTLFLDEIAELDLSLQGKLLRAIQEGEIRPVGGSKPLHVDVRIIAAGKDVLEEAVREGRFREDLYYRLNVITMTIPPLRERRDDVPILAAHFLGVFADKNRRKLEGFTHQALDRLATYNWPGNVRELENVVERAVVLSQGTLIEESDLPDHIHGSTSAGPGTLSIPWGSTLEEVERRLVLDTLDRVGGDKKLTADLLGVSQRTIYRMLERWQKK
jgi:two-component system response regulator HydG